MKGKFNSALRAYFEGRKKILSNEIEVEEKKEFKDRTMSVEELQALKDDLAKINEIISSLEAGETDKTVDEIREEIVNVIKENSSKTMNECKEYVENAVRLMTIANEPTTTPAKAQEFAKVYENQIKMLQTQLGVQVFKNAIKENAITVTPSGSLPIPSGVAMAEPAVKLPKIFEFAEEDLGGKLEGDFRGAKLRIIKVTNSGNTEGAYAEGADKTITSVTMTTTDVTPLKVATVVEGVTIEQLAFNEWMEATLKIYCSKLLFNNIEVACANVLNANSTAYDGTSGALSCKRAFLENIAVAGAIQLASAQYYGEKVAFVNEADLVTNLNAQTTTAYPVENKKIAEHITFIASGAVPSGYMYVADKAYIKKRMFKDVFVERAVSHTHDGSGNRIYTNATDFIFDLLAFFYVTDSSAVVKLKNSAVKAVIEIP